WRKLSTDGYGPPAACHCRRDGPRRVPRTPPAVRQFPEPFPRAIRAGDRYSHSDPVDTTLERLSLTLTLTLTSFRWHKPLWKLRVFRIFCRSCPPGRNRKGKRTAETVFCFKNYFT